MYHSSEENIEHILKDNFEISDIHVVSLFLSERVFLLWGGGGGRGLLYWIVFNLDIVKQATCALS